MSTPLEKFEAFMDESLIKSLADFPLERIAAPTSATQFLKTRLCFEGSGMKAQAFITCSKPFLQATCPLPAGKSELPQAVIKDWLGELGNLILGRLKNRLLAHDITIKISAPSFDGNWQKPTPSETLAIWLRSVTLGEGALIGFDCTIEGEIPDIGEAVKQTAEILPGDAIYRLNDPVNSKSNYDIISKIRSGIQQGNDTGAESEPEYMDDEDSDEADAFEASESRRVNATKSRVIKAKTYDADTEAMPKTVPKPIRILFHSKVQAPILVGLAWAQIDKLVLHFNNGLEYSICPRTLLEQGATSFGVEGVVVTFQRDGDLIRASIPTYNMHLSKSSRVA